MPQALMDEFSRRASVIEQAKERLVASFVASRGRQPTGREVIRMRQQATLETRQEKQHTRWSSWYGGGGRAPPLSSVTSRLCS